MEKSWLSIVLPSDEYKERKLLYFLAEAAVINLIVLVTLFMINRLFPHWSLTVEVVLGISIVVIIFYIVTRYLFSGMEYANIASKKSYAREKQKILLRSLTFIGLYLIIYTVLIGIPRNKSQWFEILSLLFTIAFVYYLSSYISLRRSFNKNKDVLDDG